MGIGDAGGQSSGADGAELASRLEALRQERAKRTPVVSKQAPAPEEKERRTFNHVAPQGTRNVGSKRSNRRKKAKKSKAKR